MSQDWPDPARTATLPDADPSGTTVGLGGAPTGSQETFLPEDEIRIDTESGPRQLLPARYELVGLLGQGASGLVWRAKDSLLHRHVAVKIMRPEVAGHPRLARRFLLEARVMARMNHPGIVAVHEQGTLRDGRSWYAMKEVRGRTFGEIIEDVQDNAVDGTWTGEPWSLRRAVDALARAAEAVGFAHRLGILHRDLKPANLMVGELGEVFVMDWGLARVLDDPDGELLDASLLQPAVQTHHGTVVGTPAFMPPEQARGSVDLGPWSDVYALGSVLYMLLCGRPPRGGHAEAALTKARTVTPPPPNERIRSGHAPLPPGLLRVVVRAMSDTPTDRYPDGVALAVALRAWLDGTEREAQALRRVRAAADLQPVIQGRRDEAEALRAQARELLDATPAHAPVARKAPAWLMEERAEELDLAAHRAEAEFLQIARSALQLVPDLPAALDLLATHSASRLLEAERLGDVRAAAIHEADLRASDRGRFAALLRGDGHVTLVTDPPGATVEAFRYVRRERRLMPVDVGSLGTTPLVEMALPRGSYLLQIRAPGCAPVAYPVVLGRLEHWDGRGPGQSEPTPIRLPRTGALPKGVTMVPAGWFRAGGDPHAIEALSVRRVWVDSFAIDRYPCSNREWLGFLNALVAAGEAVDPWVPRARTGKRPAWERTDGGRFALPQDNDDGLWHPDQPVVRVTWHAAQRYAAWRAQRSGLPWRLPDELEWEKAARGVDARSFPFGDHLDGTWACTSLAHHGTASSARLSQFRVDRSPYGVRHLCGNAQDWCTTAWSMDRPDAPNGAALQLDRAPQQGEFRIVKGGGWSSAPDEARSASRPVARPDNTYQRVGVRLVVSWP